MAVVDHAAVHGGEADGSARIGVADNIAPPAGLVLVCQGHGGATNATIVTKARTKAMRLSR